MYRKHLKDYIIKTSDDISYAYVKHLRAGSTLIVIDDNDLFAGIFTMHNPPQTSN